MTNTLYSEVKATFSNKPENICFHGAKGNVITYQVFFDTIGTIQHNLICTFGEVFYQKRIVANISTVPSYLALTYALNGLGATIVPIFSEDSSVVKEIYTRTKAIIYITDNIKHLNSNLLGAISISTLSALVSTRQSTLARYNKEAMIIYTSGTTGTPKGVILGNSGISHITSFMNSYMEVDESISEMVIAPLDHAFGFGRCHAVLKAGGSLFIGTTRLDIRLIVSALGEKHINAISIMPSLLTKVISVAKVQIAPIANNLKWLQTGAMKFKPEDRNTLCELFPNTTICLHFGMSESMRTTFINLNKEPKKRHTEGQASEGTQIVVLDEDGNILPPNTEGRLAIKGESLALGYVDNEYWEDNIYNGWFISNDLVIIDDDGYLHHKGRLDDIINLNGLLIHPNEVEEKLRPILEGYTFCIAGIEDPHKIRDRVIALFLEHKIDAKINIEYLSRHWQGNSDRHLIPSHIFWLEKFARTKTGKIMRSELHKLAKSGQYVNR